ncbi:MAG TPA: hypothetical protein VFT06_11375 [Flavisolibacter sp.]|nr:hypothetical protein [Flavisolibacter sp.]
MKNYVAIDPMKLLLDGKAYDIWVTIHHPHEPKIAEIEQLFERLTAEQKKEVVSKAKMLARFGEMLTDYVGTVEKIANRKVVVADK